MEKENINHFIFFILTLPSNEYNLYTKKDSQMELFLNSNNIKSYDLVEVDKKTYLQKEYSIVLIKVSLPNLEEGKDYFLEINYKSKKIPITFGNKIKIKEKQLFYHELILFPLNDTNKEMLYFLPHLSLTYTDEFIIYLNYISKNIIIDNIILKKYLLLDYNNNCKDKEIKFSILHTIFSLCIELNILPLFIININIIYDNDIDKNISIDFFQKLIGVIINNSNMSNNNEKIKEILLIICQIFCEYYFKFNNELYISLLNQKNKYFLLGFISLIKKIK